jgi:3-oxoacyl-[acyl-carrier protein] reductase
MNNLKGKKAFITGGASGIGKAIAEECAALGADIIIHYYSSKESADALVRDLSAKGSKAFAVQGDLTKEDDVNRVASFIQKTFGSLDVLVNNTGDMVKRTPLDEMTPQFMQSVIDVNLTSLLMVTKALIPLLQKNSEGASIVNLSSLAGKNGGGKGALVYAATKGAIITLTKGLAGEYAKDRIRVNCVAPGLMLGSKFHALHTSKEATENIIKSIPVGRAGTCEDVARAVGFLASEYNGFITGSCIDINGGVYA